MLTVCVPVFTAFSATRQRIPLPEIGVAEAKEIFTSVPSPLLCNETGKSTASINDFVPCKLVLKVSSKLPE